MEQEKNAIINLIESWDNNNISLALEILKGNPELKKKVREYYRKMLKSLFSKVNLDDFINFPQKLGEVLKKGSIIPKSESLKKVLPKVPIMRLNLSNKKLNEIPWWVFEMTQLIELNLSYNKISQLPDKIDNLVNLELLNLTSNHLTNIPISVGNLNNLLKLQLDFNEIEVLPASIGNLNKLLWLCLEGNKIDFLPDSLYGLKSLQWLSIEKTPLGDRHNVNSGIYTSIKSSFFKKLIENEK